MRFSSSSGAEVALGIPNDGLTHTSPKRCDAARPRATSWHLGGAELIFETDAPLVEPASSRAFGRGRRRLGVHSGTFLDRRRVVLRGIAWATSR